MITALFVRHYKIYRGLNFIPLCSDYNNQYSVLIGNNGVGKSSILEALNTFFNNTTWNKHKDGKKDEAFIAPVFLIKKSTLNDRISRETINFLNFLSEYFWTANQELHPNLSSEEYRRFFSFRDDLLQTYNREEYYFFLLGISLENKNKVFFTTFNINLINKIPDSLKTFDYDTLLSVIKDYYSFIYFSIETLADEALKIENKELQELMNKDILSEIDSILTKREFKQERRILSVIDYLNNSLNAYIDSINDIIGKIDERYAFKVEGSYFKKNLTPSDVRKKILEAYFSIRTLKKDKKEINELSSGEQRIAVIDIATAFLTESRNTFKNIILAIDEPENSLHISKAFSQFERLQKLSSTTQIMITTHWYGSLPITHSGDLHYLELNENKKIDIHSYKLNNYFEKRGKLPDDIIIKSYFELTASILSSMRSDNINWIICEGSDDKNYLEHYLNDVENLKIFSVGGCANVIKLYKYLYLPLSEKEEEKSITSKVLCLIDTDEHLNVITNLQSETKSKNLKIARIQLNKDYNVELVKPSNGGYYKPTEIEDCLNPNILFKALSETINTYGSMEQRDAIGLFSLNSDLDASVIKGEYSILSPVGIEALTQKNYIYDFIDDYRNKYLIAEKYIEIARETREAERPKLFQLISNYFNE